VSLKYAILSLLAHEPLSGYELMKLFDGSVGYFWHASHPQIYKELARLELNGDVTHRSVEQRGRPTKKIYSLSETGRRALLAWLRVPARPQRVKDEMMLKTFSYGLLSNEEAMKLIAHHREIHRARLQQYQELERFLRSGPVVTDRLRLGGYLTLLRGIRHARDYVDWCDDAAELLDQGGESLAAPRRRRARTAKTRTLKSAEPVAS
jgi:DNA-binding PadR family transcriptional regulator